MEKPVPTENAELASFNWSTPESVNSDDNVGRDTALGVLIMSYLVFGAIAMYIWPLVILHFWGCHFVFFTSVLLFPSMWITGLHYLIEWMKKYG